MRQLLVLVFALTFLSTAHGQSIRVDEHASRISFSGKTYSVALVARSSDNLENATLDLKVIQPSGAPVASSSIYEKLRVGGNKLSSSVSLPEKPKKTDDLLWYRLTYTVSAGGRELTHGVLPLFDAVQDFVLHVSAPALVQPGRKFFVRVHTSHPVVAHATPGVSIIAEVRTNAGELVISRAGRTDADGYAVLPMLLPSDAHDRLLQLSIHAERGEFRKDTENDVTVGALTRILVQSDKPLYQPGQTMHIRGLIFGDERRAVPGKKIYIEVEDEDGTVVFRDERTSSSFGVVAADWTIPDRVRLGNYRVVTKTYPGENVDLDDDSDDDAQDNPLSAAANQKTIRISRYELPTFIVNAKADRSYYLPEQTVSVDIDAEYLFGKPVPKAGVKVAQLEERTWNFSKQKWEIDEGEPTSGRTDEQGKFQTTIDVSKFWAEVDENYHKFRDVMYTAYVTDPSSGRTEERRFDIRITKYPIHLYYVPQTSSRGGVPDEFFISASYADGSPAQCDVEVRTLDGSDSGERILATARTSRYGVARVRGAKAAFSAEGDEIPLILVARDRNGQTGVTKESLWPNTGQHFLKVVTNKTILGPEDPIEAELRADSDGEVVVELAKEWKVLRSFTVHVRHHSAIVRIPYSSDFTGQLTLAAINMEAGSQSRYGPSAMRSVIYPENRDIKIGLHLDQKEYRPGQDAAATVQVRTATGASVPSVIGAVIFDKAVEERARIDEDLRDSFGFSFYGGWWYEGAAKLATLTRSDLDRVDTTEEIPADLDVAADFLLNAYGAAGNYAATFGDDYDQESPANVYKDEIHRTLQPLLAALDKERAETATLPRNRQELNALLDRHHLVWSDLKDPWGSEFVAKFSLDSYDYIFEVISPGPDKQIDTDDDLSVARRNVGFYTYTERQVTAALEEYHRKSGGFVRDLGSLTTALRNVGVDISKLRDPWQHPYIFDFGISGARFTVTAKTRGPESKPGQEYAVGTSAIDYFEETRTAIDGLLAGKVQKAGKIPDTPEEFESLLLPEVRIADLHDPYGRPYIVHESEVARYSDRWQQNNQQVKTEPMTVWMRQIRIRSVGPDGIPDTDDDFNVAVFSTVFSEVNGSGQAFSPSVHMLFTGNTGGISGVVTDQVGAVVQNASVVAVNTNTAVEYQTTTDANGTYLLRDLPPGSYKVSVHAVGFQQTALRGIIVRAQEAVEVNATLRVGSVSETVEVSAEAVQLNTEATAVSTVANRQVATDLERQATVTPRLRQYFPETLLWQPAIETDRNGRAQIKWKFADNLTTWKVSLIASTLDGRLATIDKEVKSFQPFFVEHDPPRVLTLGDRISLPVVIRNYTEKSEHVRIEMPNADWFRSTSTRIQDAALSPGGTTKLIFPFETTAATAAGKQRVVATGSTVGDAIERTVVVHPDGAELTHTDGRIIGADARWGFDVPAEIIPGSLHTDLKIYPNLLAHVTEALEGMLERPWGCGEQTISSTYTSVLLLKFEKESKRPIGPLHDRAVHYVSLGYTRLLTYVDDSGGFTYWGRGNPDLALTAYAVRFLHDASEFVAVDPKVLDRAHQWLLRQQKSDGSWAEHHWYGESPVEDAILTSYIANILAATTTPATENKDRAAEEAAIRRALDNVGKATNNFTDPYLFASYGLVEISAGQTKSVDRMLAKLRAATQDEGGGKYWDLQSNTPFYGWGHAGRVETTALAVQLFRRAGNAGDAELVNGGLEFLIEQKDRYGAWYSTQTTINVLDTLLLLGSGKTENSQGPVRVTVNGSSVPSTTSHNFGPEVIDISSLTHSGQNTIEIGGGNGALSSAQTVTDYYVQWSSPLAIPKSGPLKLNVNCDRTRAQVGAEVTCGVTAERIGSAGYGMMIAEIGIPPGVDVDRESLQKQTSENGWDLSSFDVLPDRIVAYIWPRAGGTKFSVSFTPRMAVDAQAAPHTLFDYYNPDASVTVAPDRFVVVDGNPAGTQSVASVGTD